MKNERIEIRLDDLFHVLRKRIGFLAGMTALGLVIGIFLSVLPRIRGEMPKEYVITASAVVTSRTQSESDTGKTEAPSAADLQMAVYMVDSAIFLLEQESTLQAALDAANSHVPVSELRGNLFLEQYHATQLLTMTLHWQDAREGEMILYALANAVSSALTDVFQIGSVALVAAPVTARAILGGLKISTWANLALLGLLAGVVSCIAKQMLHPLLINAQDVPGQLGLAVLGEIPSGKHGAAQENLRQRYAAAAHALDYYAGQGTGHCFAVTSAVPEEGKARTAAGIAMQLSRLGRKVLLVDLDLQNPELGRLFWLSPDQTRSVQAVLLGTPAADAVYSIADGPDLIPAWRQIEAESLMPEQLKVLQDLVRQYDYVLLDMPPVECSADILMMNQIAQAALMVVRRDYVEIRMVQHALDILEKSGIPVAGCVVTGAEHRLKKEKFGTFRKDETARQGKLVP